MIRMFKAFALIALVSLCFALPAAAQTRTSQEFRQTMGQNFSLVSTVLGKLIASNYDGLPEDVGVIREHAQYLLDNVPSMVKGKESHELFVTYAQTLKVRTTNMITVAKELEKQGASDKVNYLRPVLAEHFGQVITTCVLCHNQFRAQH